MIQGQSIFSAFRKERENIRNYARYVNTMQLCLVMGENDGKQKILFAIGIQGYSSNKCIAIDNYIQLSSHLFVKEE